MIPGDIVTSEGKPLAIKAHKTAEEQSEFCRKVGTTFLAIKSKFHADQAEMKAVVSACAEIIRQAASVAASLVAYVAQRARAWVQQQYSRRQPARSRKGTKVRGGGGRDPNDPDPDGEREKGANALYGQRPSLLEGIAFTPNENPQPQYNTLPTPTEVAHALSHLPLDKSLDLLRRTRLACGTSSRLDQVGALLLEAHSKREEVSS